MPSLPVKNRLKVLRAEHDWSQAELADQLGVARQTIVALEAGKYAPSLLWRFGSAEFFPTGRGDLRRGFRRVMEHL